jgi:exopolyphosphatase / guanosine-5'-triphosphate,3'-diphosphate pyrophosphatase
MRIAILDLGTNTFNLLIVDTSDAKRLSIIHSSKQPVKLGKGGINRKILTDDAINRGLLAIDNHLQTIRTFQGVEKIYAFATSAIREAKNGHQFIQSIKDKYDIYVHIIPGEREAELIYKGVRLSMPIGKEPVLILDIGGGSNEFIIADNRKIYWKQSYNLGMARLLEKFNPSDPINPDEIRALEIYLNQELQSLFNAVQIYEPIHLIGASGSFETFFALLANMYPDKYKAKNNPAAEIYFEDFHNLHQKLVLSTIEERRDMPGMEAVRVEMIVLASIFVNFTLKQCNLDKIYQSDYALKEGIIAEMLNL